MKLTTILTMCTFLLSSSCFSPDSGESSSGKSVTDDIHNAQIYKSDDKYYLSMILENDFIYDRIKDGPMEFSFLSKTKKINYSVDNTGTHYDLVNAYDEKEDMVVGSIKCLNVNCTKFDVISSLKLGPDSLLKGYYNQSDIKLDYERFHNVDINVYMNGTSSLDGIMYRGLLNTVLESNFKTEKKYLDITKLNGTDKETFILNLKKVKVKDNIETQHSLQIFPATKTEIAITPGIHEVDLVNVTTTGTSTKNNFKYNMIRHELNEYTISADSVLEDMHVDIVINYN